MVIMDRILVARMEEGHANAKLAANRQMPVSSRG
jgi:hypothetical protein